MALKVQSYDGSVDDANSYGDVAGMRAYFASRGVVLSSDDELLSQDLVRATDFLDGRYSFIGNQLREEQGTACPRFVPGGQASLRVREAYANVDVRYLTMYQWKVLVQACYQLAERARTAKLLPDPPSERVVEKTTKAGPIESTKKVQLAPAVPEYPAVDLALRNAGLVVSRSGGTIARG